jgi:hypothetical protein
MLRLETVLKLNPRVAGRIVKDEAVLVIPETGQVKVLNEVGSFIWANIDGILTIGEISARVCDAFDIDQTTAEADTLAFLSEIIDIGIVLADSE